MTYKMLIYKEGWLLPMALFKSCTEDCKIVMEIHIYIFYKIKNEFFVAGCVIYCKTTNTILICYL